MHSVSLAVRMRRDESVRAEKRRVRYNRYSRARYIARDTERHFSTGLFAVRRRSWTISLDSWDRETVNRGRVRARARRAFDDFTTVSKARLRVSARPETKG